MPVGGSDTGNLSNRIHLPGVNVPGVNVSGKRNARPAKWTFAQRPFSVQAANARLTRKDLKQQIDELQTSGVSKDQMAWGVEQSRTELHAPVTALMPGASTLVQVNEVEIPPIPGDGEADPVEEGSAGSLSDVPGPPEMVPTPIAQREIQAEIIPTPLGMPDVPAAELPNDAAALPPERMAKNPTENKDVGNTEPITPLPDSIKIPVALGPEDYTTWPKPDVTIVVTGQQHGYIEPCGCTGLDRQKGGVARRYTFLEDLRQQGWDLLPIDGGNQIRRVGQQASIKMSWSTEALKAMKYQVVGFGPDDMRLPSIDLLQIAASTGDDATYVAANVEFFGDGSYVPSHKVLERNGVRVGMTTVLDPESITSPLTDIEILPVVDSAKKALEEINKMNPTFRILSFFGEQKAAEQLMRDVPGYDMIICAGGYGEPTYQPEIIKDSKATLIVTGSKAMYAGLVGLYADQPLKYARVALTHEFEDAPEMRTLMAEYQEQLKALGLGGLGLTPKPHPSGEKFVGSEACGKCHTKAMNVWKFSPHFDATESIVEPSEDRGDVPRHFDPECISCHVTGWDPQNYTPYESGYADLELSKHLLGNGCENCHGPGASHAAAEEEASGISEERKMVLRASMRLPYEKAKEHCMKCHDLDNSPDFHEPDAFEDEYWPQVEHEGMD